MENLILRLTFVLILMVFLSGSAISEAQAIKWNDPTTYDEGFLPLPPSYNKLAIPLGNVTMFIMIHLSIRQILNVDTNKEIIELDTELGIEWIDWEIWKYYFEDKEARKKLEMGPDGEITINIEFLKRIWRPDIFIEEVDYERESTYLPSKFESLKFLVKNPIMPGAMSFQSRQTLKVRCEMDFQYYPADTQTCPLNIRSYSHPNHQLFLVWNPMVKVYLDQLEDSNYDFQVSDVEPGEELYDLFTTYQDPRFAAKNFSTVTFNIKIRRNLNYHLIHTCLPSVLLIFITWLCFLLPPDMVEVRIGVSMTTLLTITAMFTAVREQSPDVSYSKAIDYWMVFCIFLLFVALVLFTVIYWIRRRLASSKEGDRANANGLAENEDIQDSPQDTKLTKTYIMIVHHLRWAFVIFAIIFATFLISFSIWLLLSSDYYNWDPSEKYNAIDLGGDECTNCRFIKRFQYFKPISKKKIPEGLYRFFNIFKAVVSPKLKEIDWEASDEYEEEEEKTESAVEATTMMMTIAENNGTET